MNKTRKAYNEWKRHLLDHPDEALVIKEDGEPIGSYYRLENQRFKWLWEKHGAAIDGETAAIALRGDIQNKNRTIESCKIEETPFGR